MNNNKVAVDLQKIKEDVIQTYNALITDIEQASDFRDRSEQTNRLREYVNQTEQLVSNFLEKGR